MPDQKAIRKATLAALRKMRSDKQSVRDQGLLEIDQVGAAARHALRQYIEEERYCLPAANALVYLWLRTKSPDVWTTIQHVWDKGGGYAIFALNATAQAAVEASESGAKS